MFPLQSLAVHNPCQSVLDLKISEIFKKHLILYIFCYSILYASSNVGSYMVDV